MPMTAAGRQLATVQGLLALDPDGTYEILGGEIV